MNDAVKHGQVRINLCSQVCGFSCQHHLLQSCTAHILGNFNVNDQASGWHKVDFLFESPNAVNLVNFSFIW